MSNRFRERAENVSLWSCRSCRRASIAAGIGSAFSAAAMRHWLASRERLHTLHYLLPFFRTTLLRPPAPSNWWMTRNNGLGTRSQKLAAYKTSLDRVLWSPQVCARLTKPKIFLWSSQSELRLLWQIRDVVKAKNIPQNM